MRTRSIGLALILAASVVVLVAGCSSGGSTGLKIGLVTDVGTLNDKGFNEFSWAGTQDGATKIGAPAPKSAISQVSADIAKNIQSFVDQKFDIIVTVGFAASADTIKAAKANPKIKFIGVDQGICITEAGDPDTTFACKGNAGTLLPNLQGINWYEQQPGYLAGVVAASLSKTGHIAAVGGTAAVPAPPNFMIGYLNGAKSVNPNIKVDLKYVSAAPDKLAFNDPAAGKAFAQTMLSQSPDIDVFFQVAGGTGLGVLQAACDAKLLGIGVDVDQFEANPATSACTVTSAEKKLKKNVSDAIVRIKEGKDKGGALKLGLDTDDVGLAPFHTFQNLITPEIQKRIDDATAGLKSGAIKACDQTPTGSCKFDKAGQPIP